MSTSDVMEPWHLAHVVALGLWGGLVFAEGVVELASRTEDELRHAAKLHYWMDVLVEVPLLAAVLATGAVLAARAWPLSAIHWVKIGAALVALGANLWCVAHVIARRRRMDDLAALRRHGQRVRVSAVIGVPFAAIALYVGLIHFAR
jgi:hypothetical protein